VSLEGIKSYRKRAQEDRRRTDSGRHKARGGGSHVGERRTKIVHMQHLFSLSQNHLSDESGLLFTRVGTQGLEQRGLAVAQAQLDEVLADKGRIGIHGVGVVVVSGNAGRKSGGWVSAFEAASVALFDLLVSSSNPGAASQIARQQDEHAPEGDEEKEEVVVHGSIPHDVGVDQQHADDQHEASGNGGGGGKFNEGHGSLLVVAPAEIDQPNNEQNNANHVQKDAKGEREVAHGLVRVVVKQNVDDHVQQHCNGDEDGGNGDEVGHGSGLCAALGGGRALTTTLVQSKQRLAKREARLLCFSGGQVADRRLLAVANRGDVYLPEVAGPKVGDE